jgi:predicted RNA-binding protein with PIN domain
VQWVVDGNNVMGSRADGWWRDRAGAAVRLSQELDRWQHTHGDPVVVVFDGPDRPALTAGNRPGLDVRTSGSTARDSADDVIVALVEELCAAASLTVVTSDAGLAARLPPGVTVEGAGRFLRRLRVG